MKLVQSIEYENIPGLREAIAQERFDRTAPFLGLPETVCGVECRPLTLLDVLRLDCIGSPFVVGGMPNREACIAFLKLQQHHRCIRHWWAFVTLDWSKATEEIYRFVDEAFADAPPSGAGGDGPVYWTIAQDYIHIMGDAYGWEAEKTLGLPLSVLFPQYSVIRAHKGKSVGLFNPRSDKVRGQWLAEKNRQN